MQNDNKNTLMFIVSAFVILIGYQFFILGPQQKKAEAELQAKKAANAKLATQPGVTLDANGNPAPLRLSRDQAKAQSPRIVVDTPALSGSIALKGGRIDDLLLRKYAETVDKNSPPVELFRPEGAEHAWFADFGWAGANLPGLPDSRTVWTAAPGQVLRPNSPVTLTYDNGIGLNFTRVISVDDQAMFTVTDSVRNVGTQGLQLAPYATVQRQGITDKLGKTQIVHEGAIGVLGSGKDQKLELNKYGKWKKDKPLSTFDSVGGWAGITDKYWLAALIPGQDQTIKAQYRVTQAGGTDIYDVNFVGPTQALNPGATLTQKTRLFAGAKTVPLLRKYEYGATTPPAIWEFWSTAKAEIPRFDDAVDWGMFRFFTRPIFNILEIFYKLVGNFGLAIMLLTVLLKLILYPMADKSYESMAKIKKISPEVEKLKAKHKDDPAKQQQEMMALYAKEKINPMMGCLPMLVQIPVFYSLYKVLTVTIEMRHAPFFGWIHDLSDRDPTSIFTLFGLIHWDPATAPLIGSFLGGPLHIGVWPLLYGFTMWLTTAMNPPAGDPVQQRIFQLFPLIFTFTLSQFAVGLVIYWCWSNILTIVQQYVMMRRYGVENPIDKIIARLQGKTVGATG
ncbi:MULTISPECIES: membrane protein insertase YidC [unclassified Caulobacter]|uniref:membrane protein insertase YidC n=1 Tax=unclassified Caulobacter TaxID=2648921 RepID=UPI0006FBCA61|nr:MULTISPECIES: membrane protein insertase YidC [unclassified Caulobacter]KQV55800.1 preprotein translocase YidC [Caulobacter sp. Root342]KQV71026.1 preprotein translocase YidC [Caulobacter sp. Root343]